MTTIPGLSPKGQHGVRGGGGLDDTQGDQEDGCVPERGQPCSITDVGEAAAEANTAGLGTGTGLESTLDPNAPVALWGCRTCKLPKYVSLVVPHAPFSHAFPNPISGTTSHAPTTSTAIVQVVTGGLEQGGAASEPPRSSSPPPMAAAPNRHSPKPCNAYCWCRWHRQGVPVSPPIPLGPPQPSEPLGKCRGGPELELRAPS